MLSGVTNQDKVSTRLVTAGVRHWAPIPAVAMRNALYATFAMCVRGKTKTTELDCRGHAVAYEHKAHVDVLHRDEGGFQKDFG